MRGSHGLFEYLLVAIRMLGLRNIQCEKKRVFQRVTCKKLRRKQNPYNYCKFFARGTWKQP